MCQRGTAHLATVKSKINSHSKDTAEIETGMAEKSSLGTRQTDGRRQKLGLVWRNRKKIIQIINAYLYYRSSS